MNARETIDACLSELGAQLGLPLRLEKDGSCTMIYGDGHEASVSVPDGSDLVILHARIGRADAKDKAKFYADLLRMNLFGDRTNGCSLALDPSLETIVLWYARPVSGLDATAFSNLVGNFLQTVDHLRGIIATLRDQARKNAQSGEEGRLEPDILDRRA